MPRTADTNPYPDDMPVQVRFPLDRDQPRDAWPWLPGEIVHRCDVNEWQVIVLAPELETTEGFPMCFRDASELRDAQ